MRPNFSHLALPQLTVDVFARFFCQIRGQDDAS
ncbi:uncharacterized protein DNG_07971 [Cephalotrichum gorgonifer]|uniref:Uncharacterized protein n=1 Tax=Cephalotrichum gorgonifer TaxID=2041049 RepID=A0AAE8N497_9PEZI|nr:uncharacterized protein DNG_07971 [Cephalotrichum gorgonifer]